MGTSDLLLNHRIKSAIRTAEKYIDANETAAFKTRSMQKQYHERVEKLATNASDIPMSPTVRKAAVKALHQNWFGLNHPMADADKFSREAKALAGKKEALLGILALPGAAAKRDAMVQKRLTENDIRSAHGDTYVWAEIVALNIDRDKF